MRSLPALAAAALLLLALPSPAAGACPLAFNPPMVVFNGAGKAMVTITNAGVGAVTIASIATKGAAAGDFTVDSGLFQPPFALAPGVAFTLSVAYLPGGPGGRLATVDISLGGGLGLCTLPLQGMPPAPRIDVAPPNVAFGALGVLSKAVKSVTVTNRGTDVLHLRDFRFVDAQMSGALSLTNAPVPDANGDLPSLKPKETLTFLALCSPKAPGRFMAEVQIDSDDPLAPMTIVPITCEGAQAMLKAEPSTVDFGTVAVGSASSPKTVTLRNEGGAPITIESVTRGGPKANQFSFDDPGRFDLAGGQTRAIAVTCQPVAPGELSAMMVVTPAGFPAVTVALRCVGGTRRLVLDSGLSAAGSANFDENGQALTGARPITLRVTATVPADGLPLTIREIRSNQAAFVVDDAETSRALLMPGDSTLFRLSFAPPAAGTFDGNITVLAQDEAQPVATLPTHGTARTPANTFEEESGCALAPRRAAGTGEPLLLLLLGPALGLSRRRR